MNSLRPELLELTPQALTALSNAGFVKRSLKELENGNVPEISHENGALIATFSDGVRTQLANGQAPKEAQCSCGASGMCRHRVMLVLSYQRLCATTQPTEKEEEWDPAIWLEELATLPDATRNAHRRWSLKASPLSCSVRRAKFLCPLTDERCAFLFPQQYSFRPL